MVLKNPATKYTLRKIWVQTIALPRGKRKERILKLKITDFIWLLAFLLSYSSRVQNMPSWSAFQRLLHHRERVAKATIGYLQPITAPPTDINVIFAVINRSLDIIKELDIPHLFLEVDQAIYTKVLDVMFRIKFDGKQIFDKIVPRTGGFHVLLCLLRTIFSRFKDSGLYILQPTHLLLCISLT